MSVLIFALGVAAPASAHFDPFRGLWLPQGPSPVFAAQVENVVPDDEVDGAIHTVAAHPTDPDILFVGTVNGGIWRTDNATDSQPTWKNVTFFNSSLSIGALEFDPTSRRKMIAGIGLYSSFSRIGGARSGLLRSTNGGRSWRSIDGGGVLVGKNISGVAMRGDTIVASVDLADNFTFGEIGIFLSNDRGNTFTQVSGAAGSGLPPGISNDLVGDPTNPARLYTSVAFASLAGQADGIYRSDDTGTTWTKVSDAQIDALINLNVSTAGNVEIAVGQHDNVYVAVANFGVLSGLFRSGDGGATWTALDLPGTVEEGVFFGVHPGGQGSIHMSITADPTDANIVYVGGDRQPFAGEGSGSGNFFPNSIGANNFSARLFRVDASLPAGSQSAHLTHSNVLGAAGGGTVSNSSPHADSREMTFDAAGNLIETDDGGIYKRTNPRDGTGDWFSLNGDLEVTEIHDHAYDNNSSILISGNQDNGTTMQNLPGRLPWFFLLSGDGGDAAVDNVTLAGAGLSIRYSSAQTLFNFLATVWDQNNNLVAFNFPPLTVLNGGAQIVPQFVTPVELNEVDPTRLLVGGVNSLYESLDQGNTVTEIGPGIIAVGSGRDPVAYGVADNPDIIYTGNIDGVAVRTGPPGTAVVPQPSFPGTGSGLTIRDIVIDPDDSQTAYVINTTSVYQTTDSGATWTDLTASLTPDALTPLRSITYVPRDVGSGNTEDLLVVGGSNGVFGATESQGFTNWRTLGLGMPSVPVFDLDYDGPTMSLSAGTLGRGTFTANDIVFNQVVKPIVECVDDNGDGTYTAHFGYNNENSVNLTVPIGIANFFLFEDADQGQATTFVPGVQNDVFTVDFTGYFLTWVLDGRFAVASRFSHSCP